jgi:hypothetical protein
MGRGMPNQKYLARYCKSSSSPWKDLAFDSYFDASSVALEPATADTIKPSLPVCDTSRARERNSLSLPCDTATAF